MPDTNTFQRRVDSTAQRIGRTEEALNKRMSVGPVPYGQRKLSAPERVAYFKSLPDEQKLGLWQQMQPAEKAEMYQGLTQQGG